ncbi:Six-hairpin glycosidase-like protein [Syncephalis plumigaleata]|nr:Six-hairpin glycosidase-like protein [Syncephalis plumigaleata]
MTISLYLVLIDISWCHVMERESFEDDATASIMNKYFVNIKWIAFFGGTYFPPEDRYGQPGFKSLLKRIAMAWQSNPDKLRQSGKGIIEQFHKAFSEVSTASTSVAFDMKLAKKLFDRYSMAFDEKYGGTKGAPKFPTVPMIQFLLSMHYYGKMDSVIRQLSESSTTSSSSSLKDMSARALAMTTTTLKHMSDGGIHDHLGGGFHRYSVDEKWHVPHFEKMLYDQAQLLTIYADAYSVTGSTTFEKTAKDILKYVGRKLTDVDGGFYSAEDADSLPTSESTSKLEGAYYVWNKSEIHSLLPSAAMADLFCHRFGVKEDGNVAPSSDPHKELRHKNQTPLMMCETILNDKATVKGLLEQSEQILYEAQSKRPLPHLDDKIIVSWNGLMISACARASQLLHRDGSTALNMATRAASFIKSKLWDASNETLYPFHEDYRQTDFNEDWIEWAITLQKKQDELFWDDKQGGYFNAASGDVNLLLRLKDDQDGAEPAANSISARNLLRLHHLLDDELYLSRARQLFEAFQQTLSLQPMALPTMVTDLMMLNASTVQIVISGELSDIHVATMIQEIHRHYLPNREIAATDAGNAVYICRDFTCGQPLTDIDQLRAML